jgi:hypothetical protein
LHGVAAHTCSQQGKDQQHTPDSKNHVFHCFLLTE